MIREIKMNSREIMKNKVFSIDKGVSTLSIISVLFWAEYLLLGYNSSSLRSLGSRKPNFCFRLVRVENMIDNFIKRVPVILTLLLLLTLPVSGESQVPPTNLSASAGDGIVDLEWEEPDFGFWLRWDTDNPFTGIGTGGAVEFKAAIRFDAESLAEKNAGGRYLTEVMFIPRHGDCDYAVNIWTGGNLQGPEELIIDQEVENPVLNAWNTVILEEPFIVDPTEELWIGISYDTRGGHPAGCDGGPAVDGFGNLFFMNDNWVTLLQANPQLTYNWSIRAFVGHIEEEDGDRMGADSGIEKYDPAERETVNEILRVNSNRQRRGDENILLDINPDWSKQRTTGEEELLRNDVLGYNIYRDGVLINDELINAFTYRDTGLTNNQRYIYSATALYRSGESRMSNHAEVTPRLPEPFNLVALAGNNIVRLRWDAYDHPGLIGFNLYRDDELINDEPVFGIRYDDEDVINGNIYSYYVKSVYEGGVESRPSEAVEVSPDVLELPSNIEAVVGDGIVYLRWTAPENEDVTGYGIYRNDVMIAEQPALYLFDTEVENSQTYTYYLTAIYPVGESLPTVAIQATPEPFLVTPPPHNLSAFVSDPDEITLEWERPVRGNQVKWGSGQSVNTFGTDMAMQFKAAVRFTPFDLIEQGAGGKYLTQVRFYPTYFNSNYAVNIWTGGNVNAPRELVLEQPISEYEMNKWNTVDLDEPVFIDVRKELWVGISINTPAGRPIGGDDGPAVIGYGNMMFFNNAWAPLTSFNPGLNYNWSIQGFVSFEEDDFRLKKNAKPDGREHLVKADTKARKPVRGYNIYRNGVVLNAETLTELFYNDTGLDPEMEYEYYVTALYDDDYESEPSNVIEIMLVGIESEPQILTILYKNYPNPFNPETAITFYLAESSDVNISVYDIKGRRIAVLKNEHLDKGNHKIIWNGKDDNGTVAGSGVYLYRMTAGRYSSTRKMIMIK